jgi:hypothetical protein
MRVFWFLCLGVVVGGAAGLLGGFFIGAWLAEIDDPRCFEGSCGLAGVVMGEISGFFGAIFGPLAAIGLLSLYEQRRAKNSA